MKQSNLSRSMIYLRGKGWFIGKVEMPWNKFTKKRIDFLGIIDAIGVNGVDTVGVQACGSSDFRAHCRTLANAETSRVWVDSGNYLLLIGWRQKKVKRGGVKMNWHPRELWLDKENFEAFADEWREG